MKKIIFIALFCSFYSNALSINGLSVSSISGTNDLNVNLQTYHTSGHFYFSHSYSVLNNIITLRVCYKQQFIDQISTTNKNFNLSGLNIGTTNYTLVVNLYYATTSNIPNVYECTSIVIRDTATLNFDTVLSNIETLNIDNFESKDENFTLYPNPNNGKFNIISLQNFDVEIYDLLGQLVFTQNEVKNEIEIEIKKGIYFVRIISKNGLYVTKKIIVK